MALTLESITLPDDLAWADEFAWTPVEQSTEYTLDGALIVESAVRQAGRNITLAGGEDRAWVTRTTLLALYALAQTVREDLTLTLPDEREFNVAFRHGEGAIEARPVLSVSPPSADDFYSITLRLMEVPT